MTDPQSEPVSKELLSEAILPVIVGSGLCAALLAWRLRLQYGMSSLICSKRASLGALLIPRCGFLKLIAAENGRFLAEQLIDLADRSDGYLPVLFCPDEKQRLLLAPYAAELECRFILPDSHPLRKAASHSLLSLGKGL